MVEPDLDSISNEIAESGVEFRDGETGGFDLAKFIEENYKLFAVMGVFGAVSLYLTAISQNLTGVNDNLVNIGVVSSLILFFLVSLQIMKRAHEEADVVRLYYLNPEKATDIELVIFMTSIFLLVMVIGYITLSLPRALVSFIAFFAIFAGWVSFNEIHSRIPFPAPDADTLSEKIFLAFSGYFLRIIAVSILALVPVILIGIYFVISYDSFNLPYLIYRSVFVQERFLLPIILAYSFGVAIASGFGIVGIIHWLYPLYRSGSIDGDSESE